MSNYKRQGFLLASIVVMYTVLALIEQLVMLSTFTEIVTESVDSINALNNILSCMDQIDSSVQSVIYHNSDPANLNNIISVNIDRNEKYILEYQNSDESSAISAAFLDFSKNYKKYRNNVKSVYDSVTDGNISYAEMLYSERILPERQLCNEDIEILKKAAEKNKQDSMRKAQNRSHISLVATVILAFLAMVALLYFNKRQSNDEKELIDNRKLIEKQKATISTTLFNDVLTDAHNRMSFVNTFAKGKIKTEKETSFYFTMFDIDEFSTANVEYGTASGDMILNSTAAILKNNFDTPNVFRTGSDEFVTVFKTDPGRKGFAMYKALLEQARHDLSKPHKIKNGSLVVTYSISVVKKSTPGKIDLSVLGPLKSNLKQSRYSHPGNIIFTDLDNANNKPRHL